MPKTTLLTLALTFGLILPVLADLGQVWTDFQSYSVDLQNYIKNSTNIASSPLEFQSQTAIINSTGDLNIPNPLSAGKQVSDDLILNSISDKFENNSAVQSQILSNQINRLITFGSAFSDLGAAGQTRLKNTLLNTQTSLQNIGLYSQQSDNLLNNIQQILTSLSGTTPLSPLLNAKLISNQASLQLENIKIQTEEAKITGENLAQTIHVNHLLQYSNLNLANISQQVEELNRFGRLETATEAARLLRATSQMDLFGRKAVKESKIQDNS
jgi:hypothetical protein